LLLLLPKLLRFSLLLPLWLLPLHYWGHKIGIHSLLKR
jgi:hypothetical protein